LIRKKAVRICNQNRVNSGRLVFFLMMVVIARGGVPAEQIGQPARGSRDSARLPWEIQSIGTLDKSPRQTFNPPGEPGPGNKWILMLA
jgi:hypothetical protein